MKPGRKIITALVIVFGALAVVLYIYLDDQGISLPGGRSLTTTTPVTTPGILSVDPGSQADSPFSSIPAALSSVEFPEESIAYPGDWPADLKFPTDFILVDTSSGSIGSGNPVGRAAKLRFGVGPSLAAEQLSVFLTEKGWSVETVDKGSNGILLFFERDGGKNQGILVIVPDEQNQNFAKIMALVFP